VISIASWGVAIPSNGTVAKKAYAHDRTSVYSLREDR
jgi:hypothetical protein